jgi:hypothetical protein
MAYKTTLTNLDGVKTNLLEADHPGPYLSLVVVTRHDTSPELFNTKFRLNFGPGYRIGSTTEEMNDDPEMNPSELTIGRSSMCNMVLDYRTVSTVHAKLYFRDGMFQLQDARSSNGTMLYLQGPLKLPINQPVRLRMGRSTLAINARRSLTASIRTVFTKQKLPPCKASLEELQNIMSLAPSMIISKTARAEKEQIRTSLIRSSFREAAAANNGDANDGVAISGAVGVTNGSASPRRSSSTSPRRRSVGEGETSPRRVGGADSGAAFSPPRLLVTEEMLREIFRHHQNQLPQGICPRVSAAGAGAGGSSVSVTDGVNIDSAIILGEQSRSHRSGGAHTPPRAFFSGEGGGDSSPHSVGNSGGLSGAGAGAGAGADRDGQETAATSITPTALVYNPGLTTGAGSGSGSRATTPPGRPLSFYEDNSVHSLASLTHLTLSTLDENGNPLINQTEFLLQLDHHLQTIETCVQEAAQVAAASIGAYDTAEDRHREHTEMRVQRALISESIRKDDRSGKNIVDNEAILLAATVISTKVKM